MEKTDYDAVLDLPFANGAQNLLNQIFGWKVTRDINDCRCNLAPKRTEHANKKAQLHAQDDRCPVQCQSDAYDRPEDLGIVLAFSAQVSDGVTACVRVDVLPKQEVAPYENAEQRRVVEHPVDEHVRKVEPSVDQK